MIQKKKLFKFFKNFDYFLVHKTWSDDATSTEKSSNQKYSAKEKYPQKVQSYGRRLQFKSLRQNKVLHVEFIINLQILLQIIAFSNPV